MNKILTLFPFFINTHSQLRMSINGTSKILIFFMCINLSNRPTPKSYMHSGESIRNILWWALMSRDFTQQLPQYF